MKRSSLRAIPAVEKVMHALGDTGMPRAVVLDIVREQLGALRRQKHVPEFNTVVIDAAAAVRALRASRIQPLINATGVLVHTNFGRAPLDAAVVERLASIGANYNNLEYDVADGARGGRGAYLERSLAALCAAESATVVNNNAAALVLILRHSCASARKDVIISRGELVQIGGGFRIPDILESSGARLREVGTTNRTTIDDYARAVTSQTALILKVHRSNFFMEGFVESVPTQALAALAHRKRIPIVEDLGSGAVVDLRMVNGLEHEPTPLEVIRSGVDLVCFSGDKLLGGPQAGVIVGKRRLVTALKREPFFRALRCDKLILSALEATVEIYLQGDSARSASARWSELPLFAMARATTGDLRAHAATIVAALQGVPIKAAIGTGHSKIGGGALPRSVIESVTVDVSHDTVSTEDLARRLREQSPPLIGYIARGRLRLDLRTVFPRQDRQVIEAIRTVSRP